MRLGSVVLIDQVEKAHMSVFSGLISLLDNRILTHHNGACTIDLSDDVIITVSDLGNEDFIAEIFGKSCRYWRPTLDHSSVSDNAKQVVTEFSVYAVGCNFAFVSLAFFFFFSVFRLSGAGEESFQV